MRYPTITLLTLGLLAAAVLIGGVTAAATSKYVSHIEPGLNCNPTPGASAENIAFCEQLKREARVYGWPVDTHIQVINPELSEDNSGRRDIDWTVPVFGFGFDGIFANWAFYSSMSLLVLATPYALLVRRFSWPS